MAFENGLGLEVSAFDKPLYGFACRSSLLYGHDTICFFYRIRLGDWLRGHETLSICLVLILILSWWKYLNTLARWEKWHPERFPFRFFALRFALVMIKICTLDLSCFTITCLGEHEYPMHSLCYWIEMLLLSLYEVLHIPYTIVLHIPTMYRKISSRKRGWLICFACILGREWRDKRRIEHRSGRRSRPSSSSEKDIR